jgi:hypothetical protein
VLQCIAWPVQPAGCVPLQCILYDLPAHPGSTTCAPTSPQGASRQFDNLTAFNYLLFQPKVVQFYNDDLRQWQGLQTDTAAALLCRVYGITSLQLPSVRDQLTCSTEDCPTGSC